MKYRQFWLAVVSAFMAAQHNTSEAAAPVSVSVPEQPARVQAAASSEETVFALYEQAEYPRVLETAGELWPKPEAMPDRVLYCVAESYIRSGLAKQARTCFEILVARNPQKDDFCVGLAYTLVYGGEMDKGLALYKQALLQNRGLLTVAAEDAVALLAQGNSGGGKALFQLVIALSPEKSQYVQMYESSLRAYGLADNTRAARGKGPFVTAQPGVPVNYGRVAPEPAGRGQGGKLENFVAFSPDERSRDNTNAYASIASMQKAGENKKVIAVYEQSTGVKLPDEALQCVSMAYFQLNKPDKALAVLQPAIDRGNREALLWAGEMCMLRGDVVAANNYYGRLLARNPNDFGIYYNRGLQATRLKDYRQAIRDWERARRLVPDGPERDIRRSQLDHDLAVAYLQNGQNAKAASLLAPYTKNRPMDSLVAGDYILALAKSGQHDAAVKEGERLWPSYTEAPLLGLRSLAESYIKLGRQDQAILVYRHIAERQSDDDANWRTLAFQLLLSGRTAEGLGHYDRLLRKTENVDGIIADAVTLLNTDQYISGKTLFSLVLRKYPDQAYRERYAEVLASKNLNLAAYQQFQAMTGRREGELAGLSGMMRAALSAGDYQKFRQAFDTIVAGYGRSKAVAAMESCYKDHQPGRVETTFDVASTLHDKNFKTLSTVASLGTDAATTAGKTAGESDSRYAAIAKKGKSDAGGSQDKSTDPGYIDPETHQGLISEFMRVGKQGNGSDEKIKFDGEIRYHYAANSGPGELGKNSSGLRTYLGADAKLNKDWHAYAMLENQTELKNYNNFSKLSYLYAAGKVGEATVRAGSFGYLMAEGNIYDSRYTGVRVDAGDQLKYTLSFGRTDFTKTTGLATVRYDDYDYSLEVGVYHNKQSSGSNDSYTIKTVSGTYRFNDFSIGAMYLTSSLRAANGSHRGGVLTLGYGDLREYRPGTFSITGKYYNQASGTYIAHGMNGRGATFMQGFKGYGVGAYYTLAKHLVGGIEYYSLQDKVTGEKGKTTWFQVTHYF